MPRGWQGERRGNNPSSWAGTKQFWVLFLKRLILWAAQSFPRETWADPTLVLQLAVWHKMGFIKSVTLAVLQEEVWEESREKLLVLVLFIFLTLVWWSQRKRVGEICKDFENRSKILDNFMFPVVPDKLHMNSQQKYLLTGCLLLL